MAARGDAALLVTGNTGARRGKAHVTGFAPARSGQPILAEAPGRQLWPEGPHVACITIDALTDIWWMRGRVRGDKPDDSHAKPAEIADEFFHVAHQPRSAWSFNVEIRPCAVTW